jgi:hypothetical protein
MLKSDTIDRALSQIQKGYAQYQYFFERLNSHIWLIPLKERGFFKDPPPPRHKDDYVNFPLWPETHYLIRMAKVPEARETVMNIALGVPDTENVRVHEDLLKIALALPPGMAANFVSKAKNWIRSPYKLLLPEKIGDLIIYLATGGNMEEALDLSETALALEPSLRAGGGEDDDFYFPPDPQPLFDKWDYLRILDKAVPALASVDSIATVKLLLATLNSTIELSQTKQEDQTDNEDYLYIFQPAIEEKTTSEHLPSALLCSLRDAAETAIRNDPTQFNAVLGELKARKWTSFQRLVLHLCRVFPDLSLSEAIAQFSNPAILEHPALKHESILLLKQFFPQFPEKNRDEILGWIERGPDREEVKNWLGEKATASDVEDFCERQKRDWLAVLKDTLPESLETKLSSLIERYGQPQSLEEIDRTSSWVGPTSPISHDRLINMSPQEAINYLNSWQPSQGPPEPTPEGLGRILEKVVTNKPADYAAQAEGFRESDPTYIRFLFQGIREAIKKGSTYDWSQILELAEWVISQPREIPGRSGRSTDTDPDWGWARKAIANLLEEGFKETPAALPFMERDRIWHILHVLTDDPDPTPEHEERYGGKNMDPAQLSINTVRGDAFHALMEYALWVQRNLKEKNTGDAVSPQSFDLMPEVREVLDRHLDISREPSLTIRSIYGKWIPYIAGLDWQWLCSNLPKIFPQQESATTRFRAAWESCVVFNKPNTALLSILLPYYQLAIQQLDSVESLMLRPASPDNRLGEHLAVYYWLNKIQLNSEDGLIQEFFTHATDRIRAHVMWFIGYSASQWHENVPDSILNRLQQLFESRLGVAKSTQNTEALEKELANFSFWFISCKFNEEWCLNTLVSILEITGKIKLEGKAIHRLVELCPRFPLHCTKILKGIVEGSEDIWVIDALENDAKAILRTAMNSGDSDALLTSKRLIEHLIAKGYFEFRKLLE